MQIKLKECQLFSGMTAKAKITFADKSNILSVPYDLILEDKNGQSYILCGEDKGDGTYTSVRKDIQTGEEINYYVEAIYPEDEAEWENWEYPELP